MANPITYEQPIEWSEEDDGSLVGWDPYDQKVARPRESDHLDVEERERRTISYRVAPVAGGGWEAQAEEGPGLDHHPIGRYPNVDDAKRRCQERADHRVDAHKRRPG
jgi:hypothetical protein